MAADEGPQNEAAGKLLLPLRQRAGEDAAQKAAAPCEPARKHMVEAANVFLLDGEAGGAMIGASCADKKGLVSYKLVGALRHAPRPN